MTKTSLVKQEPQRVLPQHPLEYLGSLKGKQPAAVLNSMGQMLYPACPITEPEYVGKTYLEVACYKQMQQAADGSRDALNFVLDRTVGKPVSTNVNVAMPKSYTDYLLDLARSEGEVIDVESTGNDSEIS